MAFYIGLLISCSVTCYVFIKILGCLYSHKYSYKMRGYIGAALLYILMNFIIGLAKKPLLNTIYSIISIYVYSRVFYIIGKKEAIVKVIIIVGYMALVDFMSTIMFSLIPQRPIYSILSNDDYYLITSIVNSMIILCTFRVLGERIKKVSTNISSKYLHVFLMVLLLFELSILVYHIFYIKNFANNYFLVFIGSGFIILDIAIIHLYNIIVKGYKLEENNRLLQQEKEWITKYYNSFEKQYKQIQKIVHDIKKHLNVINNININESSKKQEYIDNLLDAIEELKIFRCSDEILCLILWDKMQICKSHNIKMEIDMEDITFDFMEKIDITSLFSNLLDNAIESCLRCKSISPELYLRVHQYKQYVVIKIRNTIEEIPLEENGRLISKKKHHVGLGIEIIKDLSDKYCGNYKYSYSGTVFESFVILSAIKQI